MSGAHLSICFRQKKRHLNGEIWRRCSSSDPQRRIARDLNISRTTVAKKFKWLGKLKKQSHKQFLEALGEVHEIYFDDLKTYIHTPCRPVSISFAVTKDRKILGFSIARCIPNSQRLIDVHKKKYGPLVDETSDSFRNLLEQVKPYVAQGAVLITDEHPVYPGHIAEIYPCHPHKRHKSKRESIAGQGELKEKGKDPLFPINHTFAMIRAHVARLVRKTWCTSKTIEGLTNHLNLYIHYHNTVLT